VKATNSIGINARCSVKTAREGHAPAPVVQAYITNSGIGPQIYAIASDYVTDTDSGILGGEAGGGEESVWAAMLRRIDSLFLNDA